MNAQFIDLDNTEQLEKLFESSHQKPVILFKHSTTCPISANVFEDVSQTDATIYLIVVQEARNVSNAIAEKTGIRHESPQAIVLRNGEAIYHASHYDVTHSDIADAIAKG